MSEEALDIELIGIVSHELKAPIGAVRGFLELLQQGGGLNETQMNYLSRAMLGLDRMERLVLNSLDMVRVVKQSDLNRIPCDLRYIIVESAAFLEPLAAQRSIRIVTDIPETIPPLLVDRERIEQVMTNLLSNAIKYNRDNGTVTIRVQDAVDRVQVAVSDTGDGIAPEDQGRIFEQFFRTSNARQMNREGTGLGLFITQMIIEKHHGYIWLESEPGQGSTFSFMLPRENLDREGDDRQPVMDVGLGEADRDHIDIYRHETGVETPDGVNDDDQESLGKVETDSTSDLV